MAAARPSWDGRWLQPPAHDAQAADQQSERDQTGRCREGTWRHAGLARRSEHRNRSEAGEQGEALTLVRGTGRAGPVDAMRRPGRAARVATVKVRDAFGR